MTDTATLLSRLRERDVRLWVEGDRLKCSAPAGALDEEMRALLASRKDEVMAFLRQAEVLKTTPSTIVPIKPDGRGPPIFAVSGHGGDVFSLVVLARHLDKEQPVLGVQPPGLDGTTEPLASVEALARFEIEQIRRHQPNGPYLIAGHCAGGTIAFEVAQQLTAAGQKLALLALIGSPFPTMFRRTQQLLFRLRYHARALALGSAAGPAPNMSAAQGPLRSREAQAGLSPAMLAELAAIRRVDSATVAAVRRYRPKVYSGEIDLFVTSDEWHQAPKWQAVARTTREHRLGDFEISDLLVEPNVEVLAAALRHRLEGGSSHAFGK